jgi:hypothetical protein
MAAELQELSLEPFSFLSCEAGLGSVYGGMNMKVTLAFLCDKGNLIHG